MSPRTCTVCVHPNREQIDVALVAGEPNRRIATQHSLSEASVRRHHDGHLPSTLLKAKEVEEVARADDLLAEVRSLQARTLAILEAAEETKELRTALGAIREARSNLELLAKLAGDLDERPLVNILIAPEVRYVIVEALSPYPEARLSVANALAELEVAEAAS
jgi:hypothetical protein